jgi:hypothetical protein
MQMLSATPRPYSTGRRSHGVAPTAVPDSLSNIITDYISFLCPAVCSLYLREMKDSQHNV